MAKKTKFKIEKNGITQKVNEVARKIPKAEEKALKKGITTFANILEKNTPVGPSREGKEGYQSVHMVDDVKWQKQTDGQYIAGYGKDTAWRAVFVNNGTIKQKGQHFFEASVDEATPIIIREVQDIIGRELT